jgi:hypothetical protein
MSAALAHPVLAARREAPRPVRLRVVQVTPGPGRPGGRQREEGRRVRRTAVPAVDGRGERRGLRAPAGPAAGVVLVPLGEVLVPVGRRPVLRVVPGGGAVEVTCERSAGPGAGAVGAPVAMPPRGRARPAGATPRPSAGRSTSGRAVGARRRRASPRSRRALVAVLAVLLAPGGARVATVGEGGSVAAAAVPSAQQVVVVERGQTLWSLARELAPDADPREVVQRLQAANRLETAGLAVGQRLVLPAAR